MKLGSRQSGYVVNEREGLQLEAEDGTGGRGQVGGVSKAPHLYPEDTDFHRDHVSLQSQSS